MNRKAFVKLLSQRFYPVLRKEGFKGSGTILRRVDEPLVHVFNVQANNMNDGVWINLGAHLTFLFTVAAPESLHDYQCAFRYRLQSPFENPEKSWPFGENEEEANAIIDELEAAWAAAGRDFLDRYASWPESFERLLEEADLESLGRDEAQVYEQIATQLGKG